MKRFFCIVAVMFVMHGTEGMLQAPHDKSVFFSPVGAQVIIHQITVDRFLDDSNVLYMSIDDFLNSEDRDKNESEYLQFIFECNDLVTRYSDYKDALTQKIIPQFEKFATEDAPCEVAGLYADTKVIDFVKYLKMRLIVLKALAER